MYRFGQRRRKLTTEETAANAARKAARERAAMTCQCCGRKHLANKGVIAHHGYTRPGYGWQTSSCFGARALPFEVDRAKLGEMIDFLKARKEGMVEYRAKTASEELPINAQWEENVYENGKRVYWMGKPKTEIKRFDVTRANWEEFKAVRGNSFYVRKFDDFKVSELQYQDRKLEAITKDIEESQKRYDSWKQTHTWNTEAETWDKI